MCFSLKYNGRECCTQRDKQKKASLHKMILFFTTNDSSNRKLRR